MSPYWRQQLGLDQPDEEPDWALVCEGDYVKFQDQRIYVAKTGYIIGFTDDGEGLVYEDEQETVAVPKWALLIAMEFMQSDG